MIRSLLSEKRRNLEGQEYYLFNSNSREKDIDMLEEIFIKYQYAMFSMMKTKTTTDVVDEIKNVFNSISYIRVDDSDMKKRPILFSVSEFIHHSLSGNTVSDKMKLAEKTVLAHPFYTRHLINKTKMNATTRALDARDGIGIFAPVVKATSNSKDRSIYLQGVKIFLHEFLHASSAWKKTLVDGRQVYYQGINTYNERGVYDDLNEGLNEYFTLKVMAQMYPGEKIECGYKDRVSMVEKMLSGFSSKEQNQIFENYVTGNGQKVLEIFKTKKDEQGKSIVDHLENYRQHGLGLEGGVSKITGKDFPLFGEKIDGCFKASSNDMGKEM